MEFSRTEAFCRLKPIFIFVHCLTCGASKHIWSAETFVAQPQRRCLLIRSSLIVTALLLNFPMECSINQPFRGRKNWKKKKCQILTPPMNNDRWPKCKCVFLFSTQIPSRLWSLDHMMQFHCCKFVNNFSHFLWLFSLYENERCAHIYVAKIFKCDSLTTIINPWL